MICPTCRTEIADNALVCYRCGTATASPPTAPPRARRAARWPLALALAVVAASALLLGRLQTGQLPREVGWAVAASGAVAVAGLLLARLRRR